MARARSRTKTWLARAVLLSGVVASLATQRPARLHDRVGPLPVEITPEQPVELELSWAGADDLVAEGCRPVLYIGLEVREQQDFGQVTARWDGFTVPFAQDKLYADAPRLSWETVVLRDDTRVLWIEVPPDVVVSGGLDVEGTYRDCWGPDAHLELEAELRSPMDVDFPADTGR